jgi:hypothetical protein
MRSSEGRFQNLEATDLWVSPLMTLPPSTVHQMISTTPGSRMEATAKTLAQHFPFAWDAEKGSKPSHGVHDNAARLHYALRTACPPSWVANPSWLAISPVAA